MQSSPKEGGDRDDEDEDDGPLLNLGQRNPIQVESNMKQKPDIVKSETTTNRVDQGYTLVGDETLGERHERERYFFDFGWDDSMFEDLGLKFLPSGTDRNKVAWAWILRYGDPHSWEECKAYVKRRTEVDVALSHKRRCIAKVEEWIALKKSTKAEKEEEIAICNKDGHSRKKQEIEILKNYIDNIEDYAEVYKPEIRKARREIAKIKKEKLDERWSSDEVSKVDRRSLKRKWDNLTDQPAYEK